MKITEDCSRSKVPTKSEMPTLALKKFVYLQCPTAVSLIVAYRTVPRMKKSSGGTVFKPNSKKTNDQKVFESVSLRQQEASKLCLLSRMTIFLIYSL